MPIILCPSCSSRGVIMRRLDGGAGCGARATVRTRVSGTPWVCRPPQLSGAAQSKGLDVGRTNAGQSPQEPVGSDPARIDNSICPRPGSTVPGSEIAAVTERRKARVSPLARRCAPVLPRGGIGNQDVALRGAPSPSIGGRGMNENSGVPAPQRTGAMTHARMSSRENRVAV
jgi:hypothetical protein